MELRPFIHKIKKSLIKLLVKNSNVFPPSLLERHGTGSYPPEKNGLHRNILLSAIKEPFSAPCFPIASIAYCEHVGVYLQLSGKYGEIAFL